MHHPKSTTPKQAVSVAQAVSGSRGVSLPAVPLLQPESAPVHSGSSTVQRLKVKLPSVDGKDPKRSYDTENEDDFQLLQQWIVAASSASINMQLNLSILYAALRVRPHKTTNEQLLIDQIAKLVSTADMESSEEGGMASSDDEEQVAKEPVENKKEKESAVTPRQLAADLQTRVPYWTESSRPPNIKTPESKGRAGGKVCSALIVDCAQAFKAMNKGTCWAYGIGFGEDEHVAFVIVPAKNDDLTIEALPSTAWVYDPWLRISCAFSEYDNKIGEVGTQWTSDKYQIKDTEGWRPAKNWFKYLGGKSIDILL